MGTSLLIALVTAFALLVVVLLTLLVRSRAESRRALAAAAAETDALRRRLDDLSERLERVTTADRVRAEQAAYVITDAGETRPEPNVPDRVVLSATVGEPLVKVVSFGHGLRRALSAESRNRIRFEMRREVKRSRKQRRADIREARREWEARQRAAMAGDGVERAGTAA
jgi:hypothetical protein